MIIYDLHDTAPTPQYFNIVDFLKLLERCSCGELLALRISFLLLCEILKIRLLCGCFSVCYTYKSEVFSSSAVHFSPQLGIAFEGSALRHNLASLPVYYFSGFPSFACFHLISEASLPFFTQCSCSPDFSISYT